MATAMAAAISLDDDQNRRAEVNAAATSCIT